MIKRRLSTGNGLFQFTLMPFGAVCYTPASFARLTELLLRGIMWKNTWCIWTMAWCKKNIKKHLKILKEVFQRFKNMYFKLYLKKCSFFQKQISFLCHIVVSSKGTETDAQKFSSVQNWPRPNNKSELKSFLGHFYSGFVEGFADTAKSLYRLIKDKSIQCF